ncbi:MAG: hypothetical protein OEZ34_17290, partial [Spirochaetia bacterium]|nr:hypothetical protein [Spirochaetia bacterium]
NLDTENLDTENLDTENLDTENLDTEIITVDLNNQMTFSDIPLPEKLMIALLENFRKQDSKEIDFTEILHYFQKESNTSSFVVMAEDQMYNVYRILTGRGLDPITQKNLYFSNRDIYLNNNEDYEILKFKGVIKEDFNFKKRFSSDFLSKHNGAFCINLYKFNFSGWIIFFYRNFDSIDIEHIYSKVENVISDFVPLFERYRMEQFPRKPFSEFNLYDQIAFCLYRMSAKATESVNIIYLTLNEFSHEVSYADFDRKWNDHLFSLMSSGDKLVRNGPDRWIILSKKLRTDQVMDHVNQFCSKCGISVTYRNIIYPDNGINVLNYMFTGPQKRMH